MKAWFWVRSTLIAAAVFGTAGCSSGRGPYPVAGQIVYDDGKPATELEGWEVTFTSDALRVSSAGTIGRDGRFTLNHLKAGDGALVGAYKVVIHLPGVTGLAGGDEEDENNAKVRRKPTKKRLAAKYSDPAQTPLSATVEAKSNDLTLQVARP